MPFDDRSPGVIELGRPHVLGVIHRDLLEIEVALAADEHSWPDDEWVALFREYPGYPAELEEPRLEHGKLRFEARDEDVVGAWSAVRERVRVTNLRYAELLEPRDRAEQATEDARREDIGRRIEAAQRLLDSVRE
jgi:hypothetical protein